MNLLPARIGALALLILAADTAVAAVGTERQYLSGRGKDDAVPWRFLCTSGANSGVWTNLPVPSHWDLHGFGTLTYKKDATNAWDERGLYEHDFEVPAEWKGKRVFLVFEGVMTDTRARLNGESVGPMHQGGFYRFKHEVTKLVKFGATNRLEVDVARRSANESVNKAERLADYWVFAGIYRPVYLEAVPPSFIERVAINAKADGTLALDVFADGMREGDAVEAQVMTLEGTPVGQTFLSAGAGDFPVARPGDTGLESPVNRQAGKPALQLATRIPSPEPWTAETPHLYTVEVRLKRGGETIHTCTQRFGFRTFEVRDGDGLYLNGQKIILKGVNRHSSWPDSGRCLSESVHRLDIETIKAMNGNAVRMSHYPPDTEFLDLCDELGLYVLDELAGWHNHYDNEVGPKLVEAMVTRDVNHPSILFWNNGNEGGFNTNLDKLFGEYDPQQRRVLHPWAPFGGINTAHYLAYDKAKIAASGEPMYYQPKPNDEVLNTNLPTGWIYMPTEFMHGLYAGGAGAGLADYWRMMMSHSNCAGGFLWVFADEGIRRPDTGEMDTAGNQAPDGVVGPYREREGSFYAIKELWSPIQVHRDADGSFTVENHHAFTDASECRFKWQLWRHPWPGEVRPTNAVLAQEEIAAPAIPPGGTGRLNIDLSEVWKEADRLTLSVTDPHGHELWTWAWPMVRLEALRELPNLSSRQARVMSETDDVIVLGFESLSVTISKRDGRLVRVTRDGNPYSLANGPRLAVGNATLRGITTTTVGGDVLVAATFDGDLNEVVWRLRSDGWLQCQFSYTATGTNDVFGVLFDYPNDRVKHKRWVGQGPYRVWKNRLAGATLGFWENEYNDTITGYRGWVYPEFKGFFADVYWLELETVEGPITVVPQGVPYIQVLTPDLPPDDLVGQTKVKVPDCGLGFLHAIPPIGSKFKPAHTTGPQGQPNVGPGACVGTVSIHLGAFR